LLSESPLATLGCHGYYHNDLSLIPVNDAKEEIFSARDYLESITGRKTDAFAFPYGSYSREIITEAKAAGFSKLLVTDFLFQEDHHDTFMRERLTINPYISVNNQMLAIIKGKYEG
jgi:peptidoglycan/xylan/chitin deacetylase (PgdA/CDA1 family)